MLTSEFYKTFFFFLVEYNVGMFCKISDQIIFDQSQPCTYLFNLPPERLKVARLNALTSPLQKFIRFLKAHLTLQMLIQPELIDKHIQYHLRVLRIGILNEDAQLVARFHHRQEVSIIFHFPQQFPAT